MPAAPRANDKFKKIAYKILGVPENMKKATTYGETPSNRNRSDVAPSGVDELMDIKRVTPQNYF